MNKRVENIKEISEYNELYIRAAIQYKYLAAEYDISKYNIVDIIDSCYRAAYTDITAGHIINKINKTNDNIIKLVPTEDFSDIENKTEDILEVLEHEKDNYNIFELCYKHPIDGFCPFYDKETRRQYFKELKQYSLMELCAGLVWSCITDSRAIYQDSFIFINSKYENTVLEYIYLWIEDYNYNEYFNIYDCIRDTNNYIMYCIVPNMDRRDKVDMIENYRNEIIHEYQDYSNNESYTCEISKNKSQYKYICNDLIRRDYCTSEQLQQLEII